MVAAINCITITKTSIINRQLEQKDQEVGPSAPPSDAKAFGAHPKGG